MPLNRILYAIGLIVVASIESVSLAPCLAQEPAQKAAATHKHSNRLVDESSPYLLQHAHNPVDWYPWGEEAIQKAQKENKMIFLSVGYSACHWCHVMERESFEDAEIAKLMNEKFVCIKVDREERPDVDQIYMTSVQMISGGGGWPMSVFLMPDTRPFWGGTYFPARTGDRGKATGFLTIINQIDNAWKKQPDTVRKQADAVTKAIKENQKPSQNPSESPAAKIQLDTVMVDRVASALASQFDPTFGGFGYSAANPNRPKFPEPSNLVYFLDRMNRASVSSTERAAAKDMLSKSLDGMISGAMVDHLGGGFHRYSVDRRWQIPHFEKMLYDNGQLASVYAQAAVEFDSEEYRRTTMGICDFVIRELKADAGAFYSALDADSEGEEGKFYRWTKEEIAAAAKTIDQFDSFADIYRFNAEPNFEGEFYAPDPRSSLTEAAKKNGKSFQALDDQLAPVRRVLFDQRSKRERPITDVKILTAWNGLMISGLADAGRLLKEPKYVDAAKSAADFITNELMDDSGRLKRTYAAGTAKLNAYLDDYAFLANGMIALFRATQDKRWLELAKKLTDKQLELFWDEADGGFYFTSSDHPALIVRVKDPVDAAIPAGTSVAAENLMFLSKHYKESKYAERLQQTLHSQIPMFRRAPGGIPRIAAVLAAYLDEKSP